MPTDRRVERSFKIIGLASFVLINLLTAEPSSAEIKTITATDKAEETVSALIGQLADAARMFVLQLLGF